MKNHIPQAAYALIGGSGTWGARFPEDLNLPDVTLLEHYKEGFETPYGRSAPFKLLQIAGVPVWRVAMHGMYGLDGRLHANPWVAAKQVAWVLQQAGVERVLVEASVGGIQSPDQAGEPLPPWSVLITDDFMMLWRPHDEQPFESAGKEIYRLRDPFCPVLRNALLKAARQQPRFAAVYTHGVYVGTQWGRFETVTEVKAFAALGGHMVGHSLTHEAIVLRQAGIHLASLNIISNHAEGEAWSGYGANFMADFYKECPHAIAPVMVSALKQVITEGAGPCSCRDHLLVGLDALPVAGA